MIFNLSKLLLPEVVLRRSIPSDDRRTRFYNISNIYIWLLIWHVAVIGITYISLDRCTNMFHEQRKDSATYCARFNAFLVAFVSLVGTSITANIAVSLLYHHFNGYKLQDVDSVSVTDNVFVMATLYKESKADIDQMISSLICDAYQNLCVVLILDGEFCVDVLFNEILNIDSSVLSAGVSVNGNHIRYAIYASEGVKYFVIVKRHNAGKKDSQCIFYELINIVYNCEQRRWHPLMPMASCLDKWVCVDSYKYVLLLDGDTIIENANTIEKMVHVLNENTEYMTICGTTQCLNKNYNLITMTQAFEYFISHLLLKLFESCIFNTLVMSGCFSMVRLRIGDDVVINNDVLSEYNKPATNLIEDNLIKFGEDRYLTSILLLKYPNFKVKYVPGINCYTDTPTTITNLILQRQRWTNSLLACHIYLLRSKFVSMRLYFLIFVELAVILALPLLIVMGVITFIMAISMQGYSAAPVVITSNIFLINFYVIILSGNFRMLQYYLAYALLSALYTVIIPYVCVLRFHIVEWNSKADLNAQTAAPQAPESCYNEIA